MPTRTRSQASQAPSPRGLLSLDDLPKRRTRSQSKADKAQVKAPAKKTASKKAAPKKVAPSKKTNPQEGQRLRDDKGRFIPKTATHGAKNPGELREEGRECEDPDSTTETAPTTEIAPPTDPPSNASEVEPPTVCTRNVRTKRRRSSTDNEHNVSDTPLSKKPRTQTSPTKQTNAGRTRSFQLTPAVIRIARNSTPLSERQRRRAIEGQGRIYKTTFRIPQLLAQNEADRLAQENARVETYTESQRGHEVAQQNQITEAELRNPANPTPALNPTPAVPETPRRGWSIGGLFSRILPSFGRTPARSEAPVTPEPATERISRTASVTATSDTAPALQPSSERVVRTRSMTSRSDLPTGQRPRLLRNQGRRGSQWEPKPLGARPTFSLFPPPIDKSRYLGDAVKKPQVESPAASPAAPSARPAEQETEIVGHERHDAASVPETNKEVANEKETKEATAIVETKASTKRKRKRSPSPDVIPNPPGCSYGMDLRYFCYSSESEDEDENGQPPEETETDARPATKKVRFEASPEETPFRVRSGAELDREWEERRNRPDFRPNPTGTYKLDYDELYASDSSSEDDAPVTSPTAARGTSERPDEEESESQMTHDVEVSSNLDEPSTSSSPFPPPPPTPRHAALPVQTPIDAAPTDEAPIDPAIEKLRSQAEKYKPKTPSGLRTASRYSSPLTAASPASPDTPMLAQQPRERFEEDHRPSGDIDDIVWPARESLLERLGVDPSIGRFFLEPPTEESINEGAEAFRRGLSAFELALG